MTISIGQLGVATPTNLGGGGSLTTAAVTTAAAGSGFVIMAITAINTGDTLTISAVDSFGNAYTKLTQLEDSSNSYCINRWYIAPGAAGYVSGGSGHTATITLTTASISDTLLALIEMPGAASSNAAFYGAAASHTYAFSSSPPYALTSLLVTPPATGAVLVSGLLCGSPSSGTGTESTGFTVETSSVVSAQAGGIGVRAITATATYTPSWSWSPTTGVVAGFSSVDSFFGGSSAGSTASIAWVT
jgi:hypothetical protein